MLDRSSQRPEGGRTSSRSASAWRLAQEVVALLLGWVIAVYVISRSRGDLSTTAVMVSIGCFVALLAGYGIESMAMRKGPTLWIGCLVLAAWSAWLPFAKPGAHLAVIGILGLAIVAATPSKWRALALGRERTFLAAHPWWAVWRLRLRRLLLAGMVVGLALAVLWGLWNSVAAI